MKFRNKATKEIRKAEMRDDGIYLFSETAEEWRKCDWEVLAKYWEEYEEEPEEYWCITARGNLHYLQDMTDENDKDHREIGNYFSSREEAEKAVEKLKAFKRLKDKGFRFEGWDNTDRSTIHYFSLFVAIEDLDGINKDLDLLFGGEE